MKRAVFDQRSVVKLQGMTGKDHALPNATCEVEIDYTHGSSTVEIIGRMQKGRDYTQVGIYSVDRQQLICDLEWLLVRLKER